MFKMAAMAAIRTIFAILDLQVPQILPTKFPVIGLSGQEKLKIDFKMVAMVAILDQR